MSPTRKPTNKSVATKQSAISKHCAFCFNAGEPETAYTSHFLRESKDPHSKVVCPLLLNNVCPDCGKKGHTRKECKAKYNKKVYEPTPTKVAIATKKVTKTNNWFDALGDSSDSEDEREQKIAPITTKTIFAPTSAFNPTANATATATKKLSAEQFPALPKSAFAAAQTEPKPKTTNKPIQVVASLQHLYPNLTVPITVPHVPTAKAPMAKIVRPSVAKMDTQCAAAVATEAEDEYESDPEITALYNSSLTARCSLPKYTASTADWAALESDSSDDDNW